MIFPQSTSEFIRLKNGSLHSLKYSGGPKLMIAFHGFGKDAKLFEVLLPTFLGNYTVYSVDLPFHGLTEWDPQNHFSKDEIVELVNNIIEKTNNNEVCILGYSMGAKLSLSILEQIPEQIERMILIAPDGIKENKWYNMSVYPSASVRYFKHIVANPSSFFSLLKIMRFFRLIPEVIYKFTRTQMETAEQRAQVYNSWMAIKGFRFNAATLKTKLATNSIRMDLIFGKYDKVIPSSIGEDFKIGSNHVFLHVVDKGHNIIDKELNLTLKEIMVS